MTTDTREAEQDQDAIDVLENAVATLATRGWAGKDIRAVFGDALDKAFA